MGRSFLNRTHVQAGFAILVALFVLPLPAGISAPADPVDAAACATKEQRIQQSVQVGPVSVGTDTPVRVAGICRAWASYGAAPGAAFDDYVDGAVSPDGARVFLLGRTYLSGQQDALLVAFETSNGTELWNVTLGTPTFDYPFNLAVSPDGAVVFVSLSSYSPTTSDDTWVIAVDAATGTILWSNLVAIVGFDRPRDLVVAPDGTRVFVVAEAFVVTTYDFLVRAHDAATGAVLWTNTHNGPANGFDTPAAAVISPDGARLYVTGRGSGASTDALTVVFDTAMGLKLWSTAYSTPASDDPRAIALSPNGQRLYLGMRTCCSPEGATIVAYGAAAGTQLWTAAFSMTSGTTLTSLLVAPDGATVYAGGSGSMGAPTYYDTWAWSVSASAGTTNWALASDGRGQDDYSDSMSLKDGRLYQAARSYKSPEWDAMAVVRDAATGEILWTDRFEGPATEFGYGAAVSAAGDRFYLMGTGFRGATNRDLLAIAYDTGLVAVLT